MTRVALRILFVDDGTAILRAVKRLLSSKAAHFEVFLADCAANALAVMASERVDVVVADYRMPNKNGLVFLTELSSSQPHIHRVLMTGEMFDVKASPDGPVQHLIAKPFAVSDLISLFETLSSTAT